MVQIHKMDLDFFIFFFMKRIISYTELNKTVLHIRRNLEGKIPTTYLKDKYACLLDVIILL